MRISNNQIFYTILQNVQRPRQRLFDAQTQLSSGKRINRYADDPVGAGQIERLRGEMQNVKQFQKNIDSGIGWMQQTETALDRLETTLTRAKSLTISAANAAKSAADRSNIAVEINQMLEDVLTVANTHFQSRYLFAGTHTTARPYIEIRDTLGNITSVTQAEDVSGSVKREVDDGAYIQVNTPGSDVFNLRDGPLATLISLRDALQKNDMDGINASIDALETALDRSLTARARVGAGMNRMETMKNSHASSEIDLTEMTSALEDADYGELAMRLGLSEVAQRAALGAASRIMQTSLVDLLT